MQLAIVRTDLDMWDILIHPRSNEVNVEQGNLSRWPSVEEAQVGKSVKLIVAKREMTGAGIGGEALSGT